MQYFPYIGDVSQKGGVGKTALSYFPYIGDVSVKDGHLTVDAVYFPYIGDVSNSYWNGYDHG